MVPGQLPEAYSHVRVGALCVLRITRRIDANSAKNAGAFLNVPGRLLQLRLFGYCLQAPSCPRRLHSQTTLGALTLARFTGRTGRAAG